MPNDTHLSWLTTLFESLGAVHVITAIGTATVSAFLVEFSRPRFVVWRTDGRAGTLRLVISSCEPYAILGRTPLGLRIQGDLRDVIVRVAGNGCSRIHVERSEDETCCSWTTDYLVPHGVFVVDLQPVGKPWPNLTSVTVSATTGWLLTPRIDRMPLSTMVGRFRHVAHELVAIALGLLVSSIAAFVVVSGFITDQHVPHALTRYVIQFDFALVLIGLVVVLLGYLMLRKRSVPEFIPAMKANPPAPSARTTKRDAVQG